MKLKSIVAAATLALASASSFASSFSFDSNSESLAYIFSVSSLSSIDIGLTSSVIGGSYGFDITSAAFDGTPFADFSAVYGSVAIDAFTFSAPAISAGLHTITVFGTNLGSTYHANVTVTPVPEPESYALLLAGLGVLAFVTSRRRGT